MNLILASSLAVGIASLAGCTSIDLNGAPVGQTQVAIEARPRPASREEPSRVTLDIQEGIESHIAGKTVADGGAFKLAHEGGELELKLVRVHREFLSKLGPTRHFACVDLATKDGDVYDVDFFLEGEPGNMKVVETTVHKFNGQPYYVWEQQEDKTWVRVAFEGARNDLLGVITDRDAFEFIYRSETPAIPSSGTMWIPLATSDNFQTVKLTTMIVPGKQRIVQDEAYGNWILVLTLSPNDGNKPIEIRYQVDRREKGVYDNTEEDLARYLLPDRLVPQTDQFKTIATEVIKERILKDQAGDLVRARALYDHVMDSMRYTRIGDQYGQGDAQYACDAKSGNCTDYHSYFIALARSVDIPARFAIGASIPSMRNDGGITSYHCWAEFYTDGKWWPIDVSEADKCTPLATYFFGRHPANRIELSRGRDLVVDPLPVSGPINFLAYPVLEIDGKQVQAKIDFSFRRRPSIPDQVGHPVLNRWAKR